MHPAVGSRVVGSPDDAATVALRGASLAFQKRPTPQPNHNHNHPAASSTTFSTGPLSSSSRHQLAADRTSRSNSPPRLHNQQHSLEHYRENGALLAATSSVERAKSPGAAAALTHARSSHLHQHTGQHASLSNATPDAFSPEIESDTVLPAGLVAARLQQLGVAPPPAASAMHATTVSAARAPSTSPSSHLVAGLSPQSPAGIAATLAKLDAKSPSLIAATLAASRSGSPTPPASRKPRRIQSVNALPEVEAVDSQPIPPTNSLISMFEADTPATNGALTQRRIPRSSPEQSVVRKSTRPTPITIKKTIVTPEPAVSKPAPTQRSSKTQMYDRPPTPPQAADKKSATATARRPPTPPAAMDSTPASVPTTPSAPSKAILQAAANKPRVTPPKSRDTLRADGSSHTVTPPKVISRSKSTTAMKTLNPAGSRPRQPSPLGLSKNLKNSAAPDLSPSNNRSPKTPRHKSPTPAVISRSTTEVLSPKPTRVTKAASIRSGTPPPAIILRPTSDVQSPPSPDPKKRTAGDKRPPTPPQPRNSQRLAPTRSGNGRPRGNSDTPVSRATSVNSMWGLPIVSSTTSNTPKVSKPQPPPPNRRESIVSAPPSPTHEPPRRRLTQSSSNPMQLNSMTNAIMASSLASARLTPHNTGSSLPPPSLPKRQRSPRLLQTLRQPLGEPEEDHDRHRRNHRHRLHANKHTHHEGSRRRWRDEVTERERKRYEALWASNRGLLLTYESPSASIGSGMGTDLSECVVNVIVRDIWKRSRLPTEELSEVWELVDREHRGYLTRQEFVVGMFLIDQRLRGRKLPPKVSDSIWSSVHGVTVLKPRPKH
ncbi:hypothetical protein PWT90_06143 [Aphanocladium album]|nr:hypothetical protein PWT90_06143 [Aphanocladium album]